MVIIEPPVMWEDRPPKGDADRAEGLRPEARLLVMPFPPPDRTAAGGVPLGYQDGQVFVDAGEMHTLVIGSTGCRKTRLVVMPTVELLIRAGESMVVADPKGEILDRTRGSLAAAGYTVKVIDLRNPAAGDCWNPLALPLELYRSADPRDRDRGRGLMADLAANIIPDQPGSDPYWRLSARRFLQGLLEVLFDSGCDAAEVNIRSLVLLRETVADPDFLPLFSERFDRRSMAYLLLVGTLNNAENTRRCILSQFDESVSAFLLQDSLAEMTGHNDIDFRQLTGGPAAFFLVVPDEKTTNHVLACFFLKQCYEQLIGTAQDRPQQRLPRRVNFVLDEFSSLPRINDFPAMIAAARSRSIRFLLVVQTRHQLEAVYGPQTMTIVSNCDNWIFFTSREREFLEDLSVLCGEDADGRRRFSVSRLQHLDRDRGEVLVFHGHGHPFLSALQDISAYPGRPYRAPAAGPRRALCPIIDAEALCRRLVSPRSRQRGGGVLTGPFPLFPSGVLTRTLADNLQRV